MNNMTDDSTTGRNGKISETTKARHGDDFYKRIGAKGGKSRVKKGFAINRDLAREAGRKGGLNSRRSASKENNNG
jgi:general stress protein YciG